VNTKTTIIFCVGLIVGAFLVAVSWPKTENKDIENFYRGYYESCLESRPLKDQDLTNNAHFCLVLTRAAYDANVDDITENGYQWPLPVFPTSQPTPVNTVSKVSNYKVVSSYTYTIYLPVVQSSCSWDYINWVWTQGVSYFLQQDVLSCYHLLYPFNPDTGTYTDAEGNPAPPLCPPPPPNAWNDIFNSSNCH